ncbi:MAG: inositol monophosphatase [Candidatus Micrarchaeota archaeon]|nr:inositol monophosphatase [Candidatus Micrarchaeota archaeon]
MSYLSEAVYTAKIAGEFLREMFTSKNIQAEYKSAKDIVTEADKGAEQIIKEYLTETFKGHRIVAEESGATGSQQAEFTWYIDPLDGTTNFFHHIPYFNVSVALEQNGTVVCGAVYNPILDEMFYAEKGKGAFLNGNRIAPSQNTDMKKAFITSCHSPGEEDTRKFIKLMEAVKREAFDMRKLGSAALELSYTACGRADAFIGIGLKPWDFKAGLLIAQESGCAAGGLYGAGIEKDNIVVCAPSLYNELRKIIAKVV